jgi:hypothetical protein
LCLQSCLLRLCCCCFLLSRSCLLLRRSFLYCLLRCCLLRCCLLSCRLLRCFLCRHSSHPLSFTVVSPPTRLVGNRTPQKCCVRQLISLDAYSQTIFLAPQHRSVTKNLPNKINSTRWNRLRPCAYRCWSKKNCQSRSRRPVTNIADAYFCRCCFVQGFLDGNFKIEFIPPHRGLCLKRKNRANGSCAVSVEKFCFELNLIHQNDHRCWQVLHPFQILVKQAFIKDKNKAKYAAMQEKNKKK